jgi:hypothetical protein
MEGTAKEDSVHGPDDRATIGCARGQHQQAHPGQTLGDLLSAEPSVRCVDLQQVRTRSGVAPVEKLLQCFDVGRRLVHLASKSHPSAWGPATRRLAAWSRKRLQIPIPHVFQ